MKDIAKILSTALADIEAAGSEDELKKLAVKYLGRKQGVLTLILRQLKDVKKEERGKIGQEANRAKLEIIANFREKRQLLGKVKKAEAINVTLPGVIPQLGHLHPLTRVIERIEEIFTSLNFEVVRGPEIETTRYNFDLLNIPPDHPARDVWDTFFVRTPGVNDRNDPRQLVLRTHTSPVQIRAMKDRRPPVRLIVPGRCYRHEATDASHETTFYQCEGLVIDRDISLANLIGTIRQFLDYFFERKVKIRVRSQYYPFVEPGMDVDMMCLICNGKGCSVCQQSGWVELIPSGMVHPAVLKKMKVNPAQYSGFAFGMGIDRLMMLYYGVNNIRLSYTGDLRFIKQF